MVSTWVGITISALGLMFIVFAALIRTLSKSVRQQTLVDSKLDNLVEDVSKLVVDKDKVHLAIFEQMKSDRDATDKRLRYLEEFWMSAGRRVIRVLEKELWQSIRMPGNGSKKQQRVLAYRLLLLISRLLLNPARLIQLRLALALTDFGSSLRQHIIL